MVKALILFIWYLIVPTLFFVFSSSIYDKKCEKEKITGVLCEKIRKTKNSRYPKMNGGRIDYIHKLIFLYEYNGMSYKNEAYDDVEIPGCKLGKIGDKSEIYVNKKNPSKIYLNETYDIESNEKAGMIFFTILLIIPILALVLY